MRTTVIIYLLLALLLAFFAPPVYCGRLRRSFLSLGDMVSSLTDMNPASFVNYGLWCGIGGGGEPVDAVDRCCRSHDHCYDEAHAGVCKSWEGHLLLVNYRYDIKETKITCRNGQSACQTAVCACDVSLALCLRKHKEAYDPRNSGLRNRAASEHDETHTRNNEAMQKL